MSKQSPTKPTPQPIAAGDLVLFKRNGSQRAIGRVLRLYEAEIYRWGGGWNRRELDLKPNAEVAEVLALINLDTYTPCRSLDSGNYTHSVLVEDLTLLDEATKQEIFQDLATKLQRIQHMLRLYETTRERDPKFQISRHALESAVGEECAKKLTPAEMLGKLYGGCYANPHLKCKVE